MKTSRTIEFFALFIAIIILIVLLVTYVNENQAKYLQEDQPNGVVNNYILSLNKGDYEKAYTYLADFPNKPDFSKFQNLISQQENEIKKSNVIIGEVIQEGQTLSFQIIIRRNYERNSPTNPNLYNNFGQLTMENGDWKILSMPAPYWSEDWNSD